MKVRYLLYDDVYDIRLDGEGNCSAFRGRSAEPPQDFLISQIDEYYGIDRIVEEKDGFCVVDIEDEFDTIMVYIDNAGDFEFAHEAVKNFLRVSHYNGHIGHPSIAEGCPFSIMPAHPPSRCLVKKPVYLLRCPLNNYKEAKS